jgi:hypothetical protein
MAMKPGNMAGLTEMMAPLNRTALKSVNGAASFATQLPGAMAKGLVANLNESFKRMSKDGSALGSAVLSKNLTQITNTAAKVAIPSAVGAVGHNWN